MRTIPNISEHLKRLDDVISTKLISAITGGINPNDLERQLFSLPPSIGSLGIPLFSEIADQELAILQTITQQLQGNIMKQNHLNDIDN